MSAIVYQRENRIFKESEDYYEKNDGGKRDLIAMLDKSGVLDSLLEGKYVLLSAYHTRSFESYDMAYIHGYTMKVTEVDKRFGEFLEDGGTINFGPPGTVRPRGL